jgi:hypothetical protein
MANNFQADLRKFGKKAMDNADKIRRASALELFQLIIFDTPVDSGRLRGNWQTTINRGANGSLDRLDINGDSTVLEAMANLGGMLDTVFFVNNLPYAEKIELDGGINERGKGMVRKHIAMWNRIVEAKARAIVAGGV